MFFDRKGETSTDLLLEEIEKVIRDATLWGGLRTVQVWFPLTNTQFTVPGEYYYGHQMFLLDHWGPTTSCVKQHLLNDQGIGGKALATNQPWFSTDVSSIPDTDCTYFNLFMFGHRSAIALPLLVNTSGIPDKYVLEFFLPHDCVQLQKKKKKISQLISTLRREVERIKERGDNFPAFQLVLQPINVVGQSGASDLLFPRENLREASVERSLPEPSYQTEQCLDPIPSTEPAKVSDAIGPGPVLSMAVSETNEERQSTGERIRNVPDTGLNGAASNTIDFRVLQVIKDRLLEKENPSETSGGRLSPEPSYQNAKCHQSETTPRTEPAEVCGDAFGEGRLLRLAVGGTSEERHATGEKTINVVPGPSPKDAEKSTGRKTTGRTGSKRDWAWQYCSPIEGNSNGVICNFCDRQINGGGITRFKSHIYNSDPSKNVKKCKRVPPHLKDEIGKRMETE